MTRHKAFICYSRKDATWLARLRVHLDPFVADGVIDVWDDTRIEVGTRWAIEIRNALGATRVAVLLVSPDFLNSAFITREEVPSLLKGVESEGVRLLPVFLRPSMVDRREYAYQDPRSTAGAS